MVAPSNGQTCRLVNMDYPMKFLYWRSLNINNDEKEEDDDR